MAHTQLDTIRQATRDYLVSIKGTTPAPADVEEGILALTKNYFDLYNAAAEKGARWRIPTKLMPVQIAEIIESLYQVALIELVDKGGSELRTQSAVLGIYQESGEYEGLYDCTEATFEKLAGRYCYGMSAKDRIEMIKHLRLIAPHVKLCRKPNLIAVNNGIFDYNTKVLMPFTPDFVFITKSRVDYNPNARNVVIHNPVDNTDWDVENWVCSLSDDPEIVNTLWEVMGAIIRPNVRWNKSAWFYAESGNNGKGTFCELMRNLCGEGTYVSLPLADMSKDFLLEPLINASAIIVDENDVGTYIDKAANLKAIITNDVIQINRKFKTPITYQFHGFMVQCLNELPRVKDKSDSFFRRQLFIPFTKCFTGAERRYIKDDYLHRQEVLEYALYKVLNMNYYELSVPEACKDALQEYKEFNDPVRQFMADIMPELQWDFVPFTFLRDLYTAWYKKNVGDKDCSKSMKTLVKDILNILPEYPDWKCDDKDKSIRPGNKMDKPEWMIDEYKLEDWYSQTYKGNDRDKKCRPSLKAYYRGIQRV